jgi:hypothetical protein
MAADTCRAAISRYWPLSLRQTAIKISYLESGWNPNAHDWNPSTGDDSWGCFQVDRYGKLAPVRPSASWLVNPDNNARYAYTLYLESNWKPWYNSAKKLGILK